MSDQSKLSLLAPQTTLSPNNTLNSGKITTGSATGNPRNKCALQPGHSLMDWIRLGNSREDLAGTRGVARPVTTTELVQHNTRNDAWMAIRGKVYNVTRYMDFHPGGVDELMKGVGQDATKMFDEVHAWVNYEQLLAKCYIGPLRVVVVANAESKQSPDSSVNFKAPTVPLFTSPSEDIVIVPRFDWIQKSTEISVMFYTKAFCNPGVIVKRLSATEISVRVLIERTSHVYKFKFAHEIKWPCKVSVSSQTGKVDIALCKAVQQVWSSYGAFETHKGMIENCSFEGEICENVKFNNDSYSTVIEFENDILSCPVGHHFSISSVVNGEEVSRSYTPVSQRYSGSQQKGSQYNHFLIKSYDNGILATHITSMPPKSHIVLSQPKGGFKLSKLLPHRQIGLISAGSGVTPILGVLDHLLARSTNRIESIQFLFFNKTENDIWCQNQLSTMAEKDERLNIRHVLSQPEDSWSGETGRISAKVLSLLLDVKSDCHVKFLCICGPPAFNDLCEKLLSEAGFDIKNVHFFKG